MIKMECKKVGMSLVELLIVLAIVGIVLGIISFRMSGSIDTMKIDAASVQIRDHIRLAQEYANLTQNRYYVEFSSAANTYGVYKSLDDSPLTEPTSGKNIFYDLDMDEQLGGGNIQSVNFGSFSIVEFDARGRPYAGKNGDFLDQDDEDNDRNEVIISYDNETVTISVEPITGKVSIE